MSSDTPIADRLDSLADRLGPVHMLMARELRGIVRDVVGLERKFQSATRWPVNSDLKQTPDKPQT
jgi:hypothetical protein